jgi:RND family efflux transporter MFP subunit
MTWLKTIKALLTATLLLPVISGTAQARDFDAILSWSKIYVVSSPLDGGISRVHVRPGESVSKGAVLIELDDEPIMIRMHQFQARVAAEKAVLADVKREYEQAQSLYEQTVLSDDELQRALHAYEKARAELKVSSAELDYARWQLKKARMTAPWDAWIVQRDAEPGQMLVAEQRSRPLLVLAKSGVMGAMAELPATTVDSIRVGQKVTVLIGDQSFPAEVSSLAMQAEARGKQPRYRVDVAFTISADDEFKAGQTATIRFP